MMSNIFFTSISAFCGSRGCVAGVGVVVELGLVAGDGEEVGGEGDVVGDVGDCGRHFTWKNMQQ